MGRDAKINFYQLVGFDSGPETKRSQSVESCTYTTSLVER
jgi:hypothetical protein